MAMTSPYRAREKTAGEAARPATSRELGWHILISMKLARYWTKESGEAARPDGSRIRVVSRGWSNESVEAASQRARDTARKLAFALASGQIERSHYLYGERPLPEPILREFRDGGDPSAMVTRNSYGALVLNTSKLMFV